MGVFITTFMSDGSGCFFFVPAFMSDGSECFFGFSVHK